MRQRKTQLWCHNGNPLWHHSLHVYHNMFMLLFRITLVGKVNKWLDPMFVFIGGLSSGVKCLPIVCVDKKWFNHSWIFWFWKWVHEEMSFLGFGMNHHVTKIRQAHYIWKIKKLNIGAWKYQAKWKCLTGVKGCGLSCVVLWQTGCMCSR